MSSVNQPCSVFWDYENIQKPRDVSCDLMFECLRESLQKLNLTMRDVRIYGADQKIINNECRAEFSDMGCDIIYTGKRGKRETADMRIAVDVSFYAMDSFNGEEEMKPTVVLITSDSDFGHLISCLRKRRVDVVLISNRGIVPRLRVNATHCLQIYDVLTPNEAVDMQGSPTSRNSIVPNNFPSNPTSSVIEPLDGSGGGGGGGVGEQQETTEQRMMNSWSTMWRSRSITQNSNHHHHFDTNLVVSANTQATAATAAAADSEARSGVYSDESDEEGSLDDTSSAVSLSDLAANNMGYRVSLLVELVRDLQVRYNCPPRRSLVGIELGKRYPQLQEKGLLKLLVDFAVKEQLLIPSGSLGDACLAVPSDPTY